MNRYRLINLLWLLLPAVALGVYGARQSRDRQEMIRAIDEGSIFAWARHITGQDVNDLTSWDEFESVAVIPGRSTKANGDTRLDDEIWVVVKRTINGSDYRYVEQFQPMDWGSDPNYCWFVDCCPGVSDSAGEPQVDANSTYDYTYMSEPGVVWGVPLYNRTPLQLDSATATDEGGGLVGLLCADQPFVAGDEIYISGTLHYNGAHTLDATTTTDKLVFADTYVAETFDGSEFVTKRIYPLNNQYGDMCMADDYTLYLCNKWDGDSMLTKIDPNGTITDGFLNVDTMPGGTQDGVRSLLSVDESVIFLNMETDVYCFNLTTNNEVWNNPDIGGSYDMDIDSSDYLYLPGNYFTGVLYNGTYFNLDIHKLDPSDGSVVENFDYTGHPKASYITQGTYCAVVDETLGVVISGGSQGVITGIRPASYLYNLGVRTLDNTAGDQVQVGGTYVEENTTNTYLIGTGQICSNGEYIYVICHTPDCTLYKYSWDGASLTLETSVTGPTYGAQIMEDIYGNILVVNTNGTVDDRFYFYDTDLTLHNIVENVDGVVLAGWRAAVTGSAYIGGRIAFKGEMGSDFSYGIDVNEVNVPNLPDMEVCVYADGRPLGVYDVTADPNGSYTVDLEDEYDVVILGLNYYSILETMPLHKQTLLGRQGHIQDVTIDFHESMGTHVGASMDYSADWLFSDDDFATAMAPYSGYKGPAPFLRGTSRDPEVYLYEWDPIPMTIRSISADMEVTIE